MADHFDYALEAQAAESLVSSLEAVEAPPELVEQARGQVRDLRARARQQALKDAAATAPTPLAPGS